MRLVDVDEVTSSLALVEFPQTPRHDDCAVVFRVLPNGGALEISGEDRWRAFEKKEVALFAGDVEDRTHNRVFLRR